MLKTGRDVHGNFLIGEEAKQSANVCRGDTDGEGGDGLAEIFRSGKIDNIGCLVFGLNTYNICYRQPAMGGSRPG